ncbi:hypothetical protein EMPS_11457 [Entomortierella parvispora]|uniref:Uncharacterized protein n=1 Tax=Entomortierella parvispora TaxID=205924 RepID=A0A9P3HMZ3_9FUNG|nr:hypothetical protein EMPS_11457 [Entomortierella parvispora]
MSSAEVLSPASPVAVRPRRGLASIKTMFSTKRHTITQIPGADSAATTPSTATTAEPAADSPLSTPSTTGSGHKSQGSVSSIFAANPKKTQEKLAEKEKKAQEKAAIQLSTVDDHGAFLPPTPLEKGYKDHFKDNDEDYFYTIISTPPDRVRTFLSAASTISPGMFSTPASKIKRHTIGSFPASAGRHSSRPSWSSTDSSASGASMSSVEEEADMTSSSSSLPPVVPPKDDHFVVAAPTKKSQVSNSNKTPGHRVQASSFLTGVSNDEFEDLTDALSDSIGSSFMPASPSSVPELMSDEEGSESSSAQSSPRHSTASLQKTDAVMEGRKKAHQQVEESFGGDLRLSH